MTGWRIGFAAGPAEVIDGMSKIQSHTTSNACSIAQKASLEAYDGPQHEVQKMVAEFQRRRNYCLMRLAAVPGLSCFKPQGAFYLFPNVRSFYDKEADGAKIRNSYGMAYYLLKEARVAIVPGDAFGADDYIRLSYATSMANLEKSMDRIVEALAKLKTAKKIKRVALSNAVTRVRKAVPVDAGDRRPDARRPGRRDGRPPRLRGPLRVERPHRRGRPPAPDQRRPSQRFLGRELPAGPGRGRRRAARRHLRRRRDRRPRAARLLSRGDADRRPGQHRPLRDRSGAWPSGWPWTSPSGSGGGAAGAVRGMSADVDGNGLILVGPPGTKKTELFFGLLADPRFKLHSNDIVFVEIAGGRAAADCVERKLYMPTTTVELDRRLAPLFDRSKCENVVLHKEDCQDVGVPAGRRLPARPGLALLLQGRQGGPRPARPGLARRPGRLRSGGRT